MEKLEWDFYERENKSDKEKVELTNDGKTIRNISKKSVYMKLRNISKENTKRIVKINKNALLFCGVVDPVDWLHKQIGCSFDMTIMENDKEIKQLENHRDECDNMVIEQQVFKKLANGEYIYELRILLKEDLVFETLYIAKEQRQLYLDMERETETEVEISGKISKQILLY